MLFPREHITQNDMRLSPEATRTYFRYTIQLTCMPAILAAQDRKYRMATNICYGAKVTR
jgi:hypothetical protein